MVSFIRHKSIGLWIYQEKDVMNDHEQPIIPPRYHAMNMKENKNTHSRPFQGSHFITGQIVISIDPKDIVQNQVKNQWKS